MNKIDHGLTIADANISMARYMESWIAGKALARRPSTVKNYRRYMRMYILPALGRMRLDAIIPAHIRQLYLQMQMENRGERTIQLQAQTRSTSTRRWMLLDRKPFPWSFYRTN